VSKTCLLVPQAGHASPETLALPIPFPPSTWSHLRGFQRQKNAHGLIDLGSKNPSHLWQDISGCSKALGEGAGMSLHPISYGCCHWLLRG